MKAMAWITAVAAAALVSIGSGAQEEIDVRPATAAAEAWLAAVDAGRYGESWDEAAPLFQEAIARDPWEVALVAARAPLGMPIARKLASATYTRQLPNAPDAEYVVIQYRTRFDNRALVVETITPMRQKDGRWRVAGYYLR